MEANVGTITVDFDKDVKVPASIDESDITIRGVLDDDVMNGEKTTTGTPLDVTVSYEGLDKEPRVILTLGDMNPTDNIVDGIKAGSVTVIFRQGAGITNPTEASESKISVSTSEDGEGTSEVGFEVFRTISLSSKSGTRGKTVTAKGAGFKDGTTATVWLDKNPNGLQESDEPVLCFETVAKDDTFSCDFTANVPPFSSSNTINAFHGRGPAGADQTATKGASWSLDPQILAVPSTAAIGDTVNVELRDFVADQNSSVFTIGGVDIDVVDGVDIKNDDGTRKPVNTGSGSKIFSITIPNGVALGRQALEITIGKTRRTTMTIGGASVTLSPSTVVPNQSVTVTGRGFTKGMLLDKILIGGTQVHADNVNPGVAEEARRVDSGGSWVGTLIVPALPPATEPGVYEFKAEDKAGRPGVTQITVAPRTIEFSPQESRSGTTVTVSGSGWPAANGASNLNPSVKVEYVLGGAPATSATATPDSNGNFTASITVPRNAPIPSTNSVKVSFEDSEGREVSETAAHRVPGAGVSVTPSSGPGGTIAVLTGEGFKGFTTLQEVKVGGITVIPNPANPSVNRDGILASSQVLIPGLDPGTHNVRVKVSDTVVSVPFTITSDDAPLASTGDQAPADAFKALIDSGNLLTVYWFDAENQAYLSYDPDPANAGFNNLDTVSGGKAYWVRLTADSTFLGKTLYAEWSQVVLP